MAPFNKVSSFWTRERKELTASKLDCCVSSLEPPTVNENDMEVLVDRLVATLVSITSVNRAGDTPRSCANTNVRSASCCGDKVVLPFDATEIEIRSVTSVGHFATSFVVSITSAKSDNFHVTEEEPDQVKMIGDEGYPICKPLAKEVTSPPEGSTGLKKFKSPFGIVCVEFSRLFQPTNAMTASPVTLKHSSIGTTRA